MTGMRTYRGIPVDDPPWAAADYEDLLATAQAMLETRRRRFPDWVREKRLTQTEADAEIATFEAIAGHWQWIVSGHGDPANLPTLIARQAALDASIDTITQIAREQRGYSRDLALQAQRVLAMRWHANLDHELALIRCTRLTREIRARSSQLKLFNHRPPPGRNERPHDVQNPHPRDLLPLPPVRPAPSLCARDRHAPQGRLSGVRNARRPRPALLARPDRRPPAHRPFLTMETAMRTQKRTARKAGIIVFPYTFQCTACRCVEHRRTPILPEGWAMEEIGNDIFVYCPEDAIDLPKGAVQ